ARSLPKRDYYCQSRRGNRLFALGLSEVALVFTAASSKADHAAIDETLSAHGRDGFAAAWLERRGLDWAVELLGPSDGVPPAIPGSIPQKEIST
ncbi:conjugal transfer protein TrbE, partial [bacterium]|nr:conjugal transfer protein TrbE [bacterium]